VGAFLSSFPLHSFSQERKKTGREQSQTGHIIIISAQTATFHPELALLPAVLSYFCP